MITGDKTTVDIDGAIALLGTEFTNNINEILTDVKAVLEKEEVTSYHKDDEGNIKIDIGFIQKPMDNIGCITNIIILLLEAKKNIPGIDAEVGWFGKLLDKQDQIANKYKEIATYITGVSQDIMTDELITADFIKSIGEKLVSISEYLDINEALLFKDWTVDNDVSSGGNSNTEFMTYQLKDDVIFIKEEEEVSTFKENMFRMFDDVDSSLQLIVSVSELLSSYMNEQKLDINNFDIKKTSEEYVIFREELQEKMEELGLKISSKMNEYTLHTFRSSYNYMETTARGMGRSLGGFAAIFHDMLSSGIFDDDIKWSDDGRKVVFPKVQKILQDFGRETKGNAVMRDGCPTGEFLNRNGRKLEIGETTKEAEYTKTMNNICHSMNFIFRRNYTNFSSWTVVLASWGFEFNEVDNIITGGGTAIEDFHHSGGLFIRDEPFKAQLMRPVSLNVNNTQRNRNNMLEREEQIRNGVDVCGSQCAYEDEGNECENRVAAISKVKKPWVVYNYCPIHIGLDKKVTNQFFSEERHAEAQAQIDELAEKGKQWKDAYRSEQDQLPVSMNNFCEDVQMWKLTYLLHHFEIQEIQYRSTEDIFNDPQVQKIWNQRDTVHKQSNSTIDKIISPVSGGMKITQFHDGLDNPDPRSRRGTTRTALQRLIMFLTVCCEECKELVPGWKIDDTENGKQVVVDLEFSDPDRFYGNHFDHFKSHPENDKYMIPSSLSDVDAKRAKNQLCITGTKCMG